jgi:hypothetical protein
MERKGLCVDIAKKPVSKKPQCKDCGRAIQRGKTCYLCVGRSLQRRYFDKDPNDRPHISFIRESFAKREVRD